MSILYPGSFNPITKAHIDIAKRVADHFDDEVIFIPATNAYRKDSLLTPFCVRYDLIKETIEGIKRLKVSDIEYRLLDILGHQPKTVETLDYNKANYLLVGADNFKYMDKWYKADELFAKIKVVVYPRRGYDIRDSKYYDQAIILKEDLFDISSTDIRANLEDTKTSLHPKTYDLIMTKYKRYFQ